MLKQVLFIFIALLSCNGFLHAQQVETEKNPRIVLLLDGSSSMLHDWTKDDIRFKAAAKIIDRLMDSVYAVNKDVEFALRVYGHQSPTSANNCYDSKQEVMFSKDNYTQMMLRLAALHPLGISPIAYSIQQSAERDMPNTADYKYSLILITDGGESCEGDICKTVELMLKKKIDFKPYIISLADYAPLRAQYACMGEYLLVTKPEDIEPVVGKIVESYRHTFIQPRSEVKILEAARKAPSVLKVRTPDVKISVPVTEPVPETKAPEVVTPKPLPMPVKQEAIVVPTPQQPAPRAPVIVVANPEPEPAALIFERPASLPMPVKEERIAVKAPRTGKPLPLVIVASKPQPDPPAPKVVTPKPLPLPVTKDPIVVKALQTEQPVTPVKPDTIIIRQAVPVKPSNVVVVNEVVEKKKEYISALGTTRKRSLPVIYTSRDVKVARVPKPVMVPIEAERPKEVVYKPMETATMSKPAVSAPKAPELKIMEYKIVAREESNETSLQVFFTDGKGRYYETAPELVLRDMKTNEPVHKFYRDVDATGTPKLQKNIPTGTFNITVTGKNGMVWQAVEIRPDSKNKYELIVTKGSLAFTYTNNPTRPVTEFAARVNVALRRGAVNKQLCSEVIAYEPDNYHVEINTNPPSHRNTDINLGELIYLGLDEPGEIKVLNPNGYKAITFFYQHGDQYEDFTPTNVKGNINQQEFLIQPNRYKVVYVKEPYAPNPTPITKYFIIKSNTITELTLD